MGDIAHGRRPVPPAQQAETGPSLEAIALMGGLLQDAVRALFATYGVQVDLDGA